MTTFDYIYDTKENVLRAVGNPQEAEKLREQGGKRVQVDSYRQLENKMNDALSQYKAAQKRIADDKDPRNNDEVKAYLLAQEKEKLDAVASEIAESWESVKAEVLTDAERGLRAAIPVTDTDRTVSEQFYNRQLIEVARAGDKNAALSAFASSIASMSDAEKTALMPYVANLSAMYGETAKTGVNNVLKAVANLDSDAYVQKRALEAFTREVNPLSKYRRYNVAVEAGKRYGDSFK